MALQFYQEWAEALQQSDAVRLQIGLLLQDDATGGAKGVDVDSINVLKKADIVAATGQSHQLYIAEDLPMSLNDTQGPYPWWPGQTGPDYAPIQLGVALSDSLSLTDTLFYRWGNWPARSTNSRLSTGDNTAVYQLDATTQVFGLVLSLTDSLNQWLDFQPGTVDSSLLYFGNFLTDTMTMSDTLLTSIGYRPAETLTMSDIFGFGFSGPFADQLTMSDALGLRYGLVLADTESANWQDAWALGFGWAEQLALSDALRIGWGVVFAETMSQSDAFVAVGPLALVLTDQLSILDSLVEQFGFGPNIPLALSDPLLMQDVDGYGYMPFGQGPYGGYSQLGFLIGFGDLISDTLLASDAFSSQFGTPGLSLTDQLTLSDALVLEYDFLFADQLSLSDNFASTLGTGVLPEQLSDSLSLSEAMVLGVGLIETDQLSLSDASVLGIGEVLSDQLTLSDALVLRYGTVLADQLSLSDALISSYGYLPVEQLTQTDALVLGIGLPFTETLSIADALVLTYGWQIAEQLSISEAVLSSIGDKISDQLSMSDMFGFGLSGPFADQLSQSDAFLLGIGLLPAEQLTLIDAPTILYGYQFSDQLVISDQFQQSLSGGGTLQLPDQLSMSDQMVLGFGYRLAEALSITDAFSYMALIPWTAAEQLTLTDSASIGFGNLFVDQLAAQTDAVILGYGEGIADALTLTDALSVGTGLPLTDQLTLSDSLGLLLGLRMVLADQLVMSDAFAPLIPLSELLTDQLSLSDAFQYSTVMGAMTLQLSDALPPALAGGYGQIPFGQAPYGALDSVLLSVGNRLVDQLTLTDLVLTTLASSGATALTDALALSDALRIGLGLKPTDQLTLIEALQTGFGQVMADANALLSDGFGYFESNAPLAWAPSDQLSMSDQLSLSLIIVYYKYAFSDQLAQVDTLNYSTGAPGQTELLTDILALSDAVIVEYDLQLLDLMVLLDEADLGYVGTLAQDQMVLSDLVRVGYGDRLIDQLSMSDQFTGFGLGFAEQLVMSDAFVPTMTGISKVLADQLVMSDAIAQLVITTGISETPSDQLSMSDQFGWWSTYRPSEALQLSDVLKLGLGLLETDQLTLIDLATVSYPVIPEILSDQLVLADALKLIESLGEALADQLVQSDAFSRVLVNAPFIGKPFVDSIQPGLLQSWLSYDFTIKPNANPLDPAYWSPDYVPIVGNSFENFPNGILNGDGSWSVLGLSTLMPGSLQVLNGAACATTTAQDCSSFYTGVPFGPDQYAVVMVGSLNAVGAIYLLVRGDASDAYLATITGPLGASAQIALYSIVSNTQTPLGSPYVGSINSGDVVRLSVVGTQITVLVNEVVVRQVTDSSLSGVSTSTGFGIHAPSSLADATVKEFSASYVGGNTLQVLNGVCATSYLDTMCGESYTGTSIGPDQECEITIGQLQGDYSDLGVFVRAGSLGNYFLMVFGPLGQSTAIQIGSEYNFAGTEGTDLGDWVGQVNPGDTVGLSIVGNKLTATLNGVPILVAFDNEFQSGQPGIFIDNFFTGDYATATILSWRSQAVVSEFVRLGFGNVVKDQLALTDNLAQQLQIPGQRIAVVADQLSLADFLWVGYGQPLADQLVLADQLQTAGPASETLSDSLTFTDAALLSESLILAEQLTQVDSTILNLASGSQQSLFDVLTQQDAVVVVQSQWVPLSDVETANWYDTLRFEDSNKAAYLRLVEIWTWNWNDSLVYLYGLAAGLADTQSQSDAISSGTGAAISDQMAVSDQFQYSLGLPFLTVAAVDQMSQSEAVSSGYGSKVSDTGALSDQLAMLEAFQLTLQDTTPVVRDALSQLFTYGLQTGDVMAFQEQLVVLYGLLVNDGLTQVDQLVPQMVIPLYLMLTDTETTAWFDQFLFTMIFSPSKITMAMLVVMAEMVAAEIAVYGEVRADDVSNELWEGNVEVL